MQIIRAIEGKLSGQFDADTVDATLVHRQDGELYSPETNYFVDTGEILLDFEQQPSYRLAVVGLFAQVVILVETGHLAEISK